MVNNNITVSIPTEKQIINHMQVEKFRAKGLLLLSPRVFPDPRGFFCERYKKSVFSEAGLDVDFVQDNFSRSAPGVLRGLHYQWDKPQGKLVTCLSGQIFDVAVDIRHGSPTFGVVTSVVLSGDKPQWFWIPAGFAHGFYVMGNQHADIFYKCDAEYCPQAEGGVSWADAQLAIQWPGVHSPSQVFLSPRDEKMPGLAEYKKNPRFQWSET